MRATRLWGANDLQIAGDKLLLAAWLCCWLTRRPPHGAGDFSAQWGGIGCSSGVGTVGNGTYTALVALIAEATVAWEKGWR